MRRIVRQDRSRLSRFRRPHTVHAILFTAQFHFHNPWTSRIPPASVNHVRASEQSPTFLARCNVSTRLICADCMARSRRGIQKSNKRTKAEKRARRKRRDREELATCGTLYFDLVSSTLGGLVTYSVPKAFYIPTKLCITFYYYILLCKNSVQDYL